MITALAIIFFVFGLAVGSFLNVIIFRYNTHRSFRGRSGCMTCQKKLSWYELVPVFSFLFLGGRCYGCKAKISLQYPLIELISGLVFLGLFLKFQNVFFFDTLGFSLDLAFYGTVFSLLLVTAMYDLRHKIIPDAFSLALGILTFLGLFFFAGQGFTPHWPTLLDLFSGIIIAAPFALLWFFSRGSWMGLGDAKLAISLGWLLGLSAGLSALVVSFWAGAVVGIGLVIFSKRHGMKSEVPFAPFLVFGTMLVFLLGVQIFSLGF